MRSFSGSAGELTIALAYFIGAWCHSSRNSRRILLKNVATSMNGARERMVFITATLCIPCRQNLNFHFCVTLADAHAWPKAKRQVYERIAALQFRSVHFIVPLPSLRYVAVAVGEVFLAVMQQYVGHKEIGLPVNIQIMSMRNSNGIFSQFVPYEESDIHPGLGSFRQPAPLPVPAVEIATILCSKLGSSRIDRSYQW